jgi:NADH-quinone oxidoreductase subunit N
MSAVALYYYLILLKQAWIAEDVRGRGAIEVPPAAALGLVLAAGLLVVLGAFPSLLLGRF